MAPIRVILVLFFLLLPLFSIGQTGAWVYIDPISPQAKITPTGFPSKLIIPVGGALLIGGVATALIITNTGSSSPNPQPVEPTPSPFEVNDDNFSVPCGQTSTINPLANDIGQGLSIDSLIGAPAGVEIIANNLIQLPGNLLVNFSFFILVSDNNGNTSTSLVTVSVNTPNFNLVDDFYNINSGETLADNVLNNDDCTNCIVFSIAGGPGTLNWDAQGNFTYTTPLDFSGIVFYTVSIADACGQNGTSNLNFEVTNTVCEFSWPGIVETTPTTCGLLSGTASPSADHIGDFNFTWSNGFEGIVNTGLAVGDHELYVFDPETGCTDTIGFSIDEIPFDFVIAIEVINGVCGNTGDANISLNVDPTNPVNISIEGPNGTLIENWTESSLLLSSVIPLIEGTYLLTFFNPSNPDCTESITVEITASPAPVIVINFVQNPGPPEFANGVVSVLLSDFALPIDLFLNGFFVLTAFEPLIELEGLLPGEYELYGVGADGCISEVLFFFLLPEGIAPPNDFNQPIISPSFRTANPMMNQINGFTQHIFEGESEVTIVPMYFSNPLQLEFYHNDWFFNFGFNKLNYTFSNNNQLYSGQIEFFESSIGKNVSVFSKQMKLETGVVRWQSQGNQEFVATGIFSKIGYPISIGKKTTATVDLQAGWVNQLMIAPGITIRP